MRRKLLTCHLCLQPEMPKKGEDKERCVMSDEKALQCCGFLTSAFFSNCNVKIIVKNNVLFKQNTYQHICHPFS